MSLRTAPLLYVFYETSRLADERQLFESTIGLPVIEVEPHLPHHRHGVFKYDAGDVILSHNLSGPGHFAPGESDGLVTTFAIPADRSIEDMCAVARLTQHAEDVVTDGEGHHYRVVQSPEFTRAFVPELSLIVSDLEESIRFYGDLLDLPLLEHAGDTASFATGSVNLQLIGAARAPDGRLPRYHSHLVVFHAADVNRMHRALLERGLVFKGHRAGFSEIGATIRFDDPSGHRLCLYEPSDESLTWGSGPKVLSIIGRAAAIR